MNPHIILYHNNFKSKPFYKKKNHRKEIVVLWKYKKTIKIITT